jgi:molecular chaperone GrpE
MVEDKKREEKKEDGLGANSQATMENKEENKVEKKESEEAKKVEEELAKANEEAVHRKNEYYKAYADMANLRKDIERDHREIKKYRIEGFVDKLIAVLDGFEMAFRAPAQSPEVKNYLTGFQYIYNQLLKTLEDEGVSVIEPKVGDKFDVDTMHVVETVEDPGEEHIVKKVSCKGYKLYDHLIRAAMVTTSIHPKASPDVKADETQKTEDIKKEGVNVA